MEPESSQVGCQERWGGVHEARGPDFCVCLCLRACPGCGVQWRSENNSQELVLSSHCVEPGD